MLKFCHRLVCCVSVHSLVAAIELLVVCACCVVYVCVVWCVCGVGSVRAHVYGLCVLVVGGADLKVSWVQNSLWASQELLYFWWISALPVLYSGSSDSDKWDCSASFRFINHVWIWIELCKLKVLTIFMSFYVSRSWSQDTLLWKYLLCDIFL